MAPEQIALGVTLIMIGIGALAIKEWIEGNRPRF